MYTPMTSKHFTARIDPKSGMTYYVLSTRVAPIQQGFYFINSGCDDARRYLWFYCAFPPSTGHCAGVIDFASDEVRFFPDTFGSGWMVDPLTGNLYWGNSQGLYMRTANPQDKPVQIARMPEECARFLGSSMGGTHLTFSPDRSELFVTSRAPTARIWAVWTWRPASTASGIKPKRGFPITMRSFARPIPIWSWSPMRARTAL